MHSPFWTPYTMKHAPLKLKLPSSSMQLIVTLPGALLKARNLGKQPCQSVSISKQKDMVINRQSCQPVATSCKNRSPTPHPHTRSKADTRQPCQPTSTSYRARSPSNANVRTSCKVSPYHYKRTTIHSTSTHFNYTKFHHTALKINQ